MHFPARARPLRLAACVATMLAALLAVPSIEGRTMIGSCEPSGAWSLWSGDYGNYMTVTKTASVADCTSINLYDKALTTLPDGAFSGLTGLTSLNLGNNQLTWLPDGVFSGLTSLEYVDLSNNQLTSLPDGVFSGLNSLGYVYILNNPLASSSDVCDLQRVYGSRTKLTKVFMGRGKLTVKYLCTRQEQNVLIAALVIIACGVMLVLAISRRDISTSFALLIFFSTLDFVSDIWYAFTTPLWVKTDPEQSIPIDPMGNVGYHGSTNDTEPQKSKVQVFAFALSIKTRPQPRSVLHWRSRLTSAIQIHQIPRKVLHAGDVDDGVKFVLNFASHLLWGFTNPHWALLSIVFWSLSALFTIALFAFGFLLFCTKIFAVSKIRDAWFSEWTVDFTPTKHEDDVGGLANGHYQFAFFSEVILESIPQLIIQVVNQSKTSFTVEGIISAVFTSVTIYLHLYKFVYYVLILRMPLSQVPLVSEKFRGDQVSGGGATGAVDTDGGGGGGGKSTTNKTIVGGGAWSLAAVLGAGNSNLVVAGGQSNDVEMAELKSRVSNLEERVALLEVEPK